MATLKEYKCTCCGHRVMAASKGEDMTMSGEIIEAPVPHKCPECGGKMRQTGVVCMVD